MILYESYYRTDTFPKNHVSRDPKTGLVSSDYLLYLKENHKAVEEDFEVYLNSVYFNQQPNKVIKVSWKIEVIDL